MQTFYKVMYLNEAIKFLQKNKLIGLKFYEAFAKLAKNSNLRASSFDIVAMKGQKNVYRLRIGQYRAIFSVAKEIRPVRQPCIKTNIKV